MGLDIKQPKATSAATHEDKGFASTRGYEHGWLEAEKDASLPCSRRLRLPRGLEARQRMIDFRIVNTGRTWKVTVQLASSARQLIGVSTALSAGDKIVVYRGGNQVSV